MSITISKVEVIPPNAIKVLVTRTDETEAIGKFSISCKNSRIYKLNSWTLYVQMFEDSLLTADSASLKQLCAHGRKGDTFKVSIES